MSIYVPFDDQKKQDASFTLQSMGIQLGVNIGTAIVVMIGFSLLRPRNSLVYAPKAKFSAEQNRPPPIESTGWLSWIKPVFRVNDEILIKQIGCDAVLFIRFLRLLRKLLLCMSIVGIGALIPVYIVATKATGDWPPATGSIEILSISGINSQNGKLRADPDNVWYWAPFSATWLFSILIAYFMYRASCDYIDMRQYYFRLPSNEATMKSLMVSHIPKEKQTDRDLKEWIESTRAIQYPIKDSMMGHHSSKLSDLFESHELAVHQLETSLAAYLSDGKKEAKKRPTVRVNGMFFGLFGGKKVDAIEYYTKQVGDLDGQIKQLRKNDSKTAPYGWISFDKIEYAHTTERALQKWLKKTKNEDVFHVRISPTPQNLVWNNLPLDDKTRKTKRWMGRVFYWIFVFIWMIPMTALSAASNIINLIRLIPNSAEFIESHQVLMSFIQAYFTPIVMAIFFYFLPSIFRLISQQQGYWTHTTLDRKVLTKLYVFFIINNLLVFTLTSMLIGIYGQIRSLIESGSLPTDESISEYIMQIARNIQEVSTFWINFVCLKSLGLTMDLAMVVPLLTITIKKFLTRPSPRELRELAKPPEFNFPQNYNLLLFFFTIALVYSAMSPLILPFALVYFSVAGLVYKYMLMYVYVTKIESGGKIWPVLFQTIMTSVVFFQATMIVILVLKGGNLQAYILIPLPFLTLVFQYFYYRRMHVLGSYLIGTDSNLPSSYIDESFMGDTTTKKTKKSSLRTQFQDPVYRDKLSKPTVHEDVKHLLPKVYRNEHQPTYVKQEQQQQQQQQKTHYKINETFEMAQKFSKDVVKDMDLDKQKGFSHKHQLYDEGCPISFEAVTEDQILEPDSDSSEDEKEDVAQIKHYDDHKLSKFNTASSSNYAASSYHTNSDTVPLLQHSPPPPPPLPAHNQFLVAPQSRQPLSNDRNITSEYIEMYSSFTPNASAVDVIDDARPVSLDEFGAIPINDDDGEEELVILSDHDYKRHTMPYTVGMTSEENSTARHQSLPNMYHPSLASVEYNSEEDDENDDEIDHAVTTKAVELKRQMSAPIFHRRRVHEEGVKSDLKRFNTMPSKQKIITNPFILEEEGEELVTSPDDNEKVLVEEDEEKDEKALVEENEQERTKNYRFS